MDIPKKSSLLRSFDGRSHSIYNVPREFDLVSKNNGTPKYTFGLSRETCKVPKDKTKNYAKLYMNLQGLLSITRLIDGDLYELEYAPGQEPALIIFDKQDVLFYMKSHLKDELMSLNNFQLLKIEPKKCIVCKTIPNNPTEIFNDLDKFKNFQ